MDRARLPGGLWMALLMEMKGVLVSGNEAVVKTLSMVAVVVRIGWRWIEVYSPRASCAA